MRNRRKEKLPQQQTERVFEEEYLFTLILRLIRECFKKSEKEKYERKTIRNQTGEKIANRTYFASLLRYF